MSLFDIVCVTNRTLCRDDFLTRLRRITRCRPYAILLREKDMAPEEYERLAKSVIDICENTLCVLHGFTGIAQKLHVKAIHLPFAALLRDGIAARENFEILGISCHSAEEARRAEAMGCDYITFGHVFDTDCKPGLPPRGVGLLRQVVGSVGVPVYAIGGIGPENIAEVRAAGAAGACIMSGLMRCDDVGAYMRGIRAMLR